MFNALLAVSTYLALFALFWIAVETGHWFGGRQKEASGNRLGIVKVAEGTVFALLGLLVAFTFSGAYERFEARKIRIIDEVNAIDSAYSAIGLLASDTQAGLRTMLHQYLDARIAMYDEVSEAANLDKLFEDYNQVRNRVWQQALIAVKKTNNDATTLFFMRAIDDMFTIATTRIIIMKIHPPIPIFILLIGLAGLSSFLVGYTTARKQFYSRIFTVSYIAITSFTIYIILDLEFPRLGLIRVNAFDHLLVEEKKLLD